MTDPSNVLKEVTPAREPESQIQTLLSQVQAFMKVLNDGKWWLPPIASLISILLLSKYLWVIGHPELILSSIGSPSNLLVWLVFTALGFLFLLLSFSIPALSFTICMTVASPKREDEPALAKNLGNIVIAGFAMMALYLLSAALDHPISTWLIFAITFITSTAAVIALQNKNLPPKTKFPPSQQRKLKSKKIKALFKSAVLGFLLAFTALSGTFPSRIAILAWRGADDDLEAVLAIAACLIAMTGYLFPIIFFYQAEGSLIQRAGKASLAMLLAIFVNAMLMPTIFDIWVYSAANLLKLRDDRPLGYILDKKDYPKALFGSPSWGLQSIDDSEDFFSVNAFRQFRLGDVLLLCPAPYSKVSLKLVGTFSERCIAVSESKIKVAAKRIQTPTQNFQTSLCLLATRTQTKTPLPIKNSTQCIYKSTF
ncbi:hypothetical protein [Pseudomonas gingeri]